MRIIYHSSLIASIALSLSILPTVLAETAKKKAASPQPSKSTTIANGVNEDAKKYVEAKEIGYLQLDHKNLVKSKELQILARKKPDSRITRIATAKAWKAFAEKFAGIEVRTGKPLSLKPDFTQQQLLVFYAGPELRGDSFSDIEIYAGKKTLNSFIFHGPTQSKDPAAICKAAKQPFHGTFYLATVPKKFEKHALEFRMAYQSWGRECSRFSPLVTNKPNDKKAAKP